jgi:hypothetical protein
MFCAAQASAQNFPSKPVSIVVPYPAGGATDVIARMVAEKLSQNWGQPVIVNNKPGAGTVIAAEMVARSPGDGYTLYMTTAAHTISASLYKKLAYDPIKDFAPITQISTIPLVLVVTPSLPVKTLPELIAYAKSHPGMSFASTGNGTPQHLTGELFKAQNKLELVHVPYRGDAPMLTDLIGGPGAHGIRDAFGGVIAHQGGQAEGDCAGASETRRRDSGYSHLRAVRHARLHRGDLVRHAGSRQLAGQFAEQDLPGCRQDSRQSGIHRQADRNGRRSRQYFAAGISGFYPERKQTLGGGGAPVGRAGRLRQNLRAPDSITVKDFAAIKIDRNEFHGGWNYCIHSG